MAEISIDTGGMKRQEEVLQRVINRLQNAENDLYGVNNKIEGYLSSQAYWNIRRKISDITDKIDDNNRSVQSLKSVLAASRELYQNTEDKVEAYFHKTSAVDWSQTGSFTEWTQTVDMGNKEYTVQNKSWSSSWVDFWNKLSAEGEFDDAWHQWAVGVNGTTAGTLWSSLITGTIGKIHAENGWESKWKIEDGDFNLGYKGKLEASAAELTLKNQYGLLESETEIGLGNFNADGEIYASVFRDGVFSPGIGIAAGVSGSVLSGKKKVQLGTDDVNAYAEASGDLLSAEAKGKAGFGAKKTKDGYGFFAEAEGELGAYVAEGEITGGFEFFGIEIEASLEGKIGTGVEAKAGIDSGGATVGVGAAALFGGGVELHVDWSEAVDNVIEATDNVKESWTYFINNFGDWW